MQRYTVYCICKLLYMFRVLLPPAAIEYTTRCNVTQFIVSGNCSTCFEWYLHSSSGAHTTVSTALSDRDCYLRLIAADSSNGLTNTRCCRCSCMRSWWWVEVPPETCRAVSRYNKLCNVASCWMYIGIALWNFSYFSYFLKTGTRTSDTHFGHQVKCPIFFLDFKQIWNLTAGFHS